MNTITFFINDEDVFEYEKKVLDEQQLDFLDNMDGSMDGGIKIQGELMTNPDVKQRASFVAMNLIRALQQENEAIIQSSFAYLSQRMPLLVECRASNHNGTIDIEFIEEH